MKHRTAVIAGKRVVVTWQETDSTVEATVDGRTYDSTSRRLGNGARSGWGRMDSRWRLWWCRRDDGYEVAIHGNRISVEFLDSTRKASSPGAGASGGIVDVRAPMPGKIVRVLLAHRTQKSEAHQGIVVMEAMKMQNEIRSPKGGRSWSLVLSKGTR